MGGALARGLCQKGSGNYQVAAIEPHEHKHPDLRQSVRVFTNLSLYPDRPAVVILCLKPQDLRYSPEGTAQLLLQHRPLLLSIVAGVTTGDLAELYGYSGPIVRAMPNICAMVAQSATAACANSVCSEQDVEAADLILSAIGEVSWTKEKLLDAVTGLSGSGPAYLYMVIESLTDGGVKMGLPRWLALKLVTQTVL